MAISFTCPHCGHAFQVEDSYAGKTGPCMACGQQMTVPGGSSAFAASASYDPAPPKGSSAPMIIGILAGALVVMFMCGGVLVALLLPAVQAAREAARRAQCMNNSKQIVLGMHNHSDIHGTLPIASTSPVSSTPGSAAAGYSWIVPLLPYIEEQMTFDEIESNSEDFTKTPFESNQDMAEYSFSLLKCPSANDLELSPSASAVYSTTPLPGISNYVANSASHLTNAQGPAELTDSSGFKGDGVIVFPTAVSTDPSQGLALRAITDGTSNTVVFCESKEEIYAAWIDGQAVWGVAAWPENVDVPTTGSDGFLGWPDSDVSSMTSLEVAQEHRNDPSLFYMASSRFGGNIDRQFGPSSNHASGSVVHAFADGHVQVISSDIDRTIYLRMFSRDGGEVLNLDQLND
jgi:hypothetical protein